MIVDDVRYVCVCMFQGGFFGWYMRRLLVYIGMLYHVWNFNLILNPWNCTQVRCTFQYNPELPWYASDNITSISAHCARIRIQMVWRTRLLRLSECGMDWNIQHRDECLSRRLIEMNVEPNTVWFTRYTFDCLVAVPARRLFPRYDNFLVIIRFSCKMFALLFA